MKGEVTDRWGVKRTLDGPFWPLGLGPLGPAPSLRDGGEVMMTERARQMKDLVLSKSAHLFTGKSIREAESALTWKRPIVVFDTELSPPLEVRMRRVDVLKEEANELLFESRFESGNLKQARRM